MNTKHDPDVTIAAWLDDGPNNLPPITRQVVVSSIHVTPQRRKPLVWLPWRFPTMNTPLRVGVAAVIGLLLLGAGIYLFGGSGPGIGGQPAVTPTPTPAITPEPSPAPLAVGDFGSHGGQIQLDAMGDDTNVTGTMTYTDLGGAELGGFVVDLACTRTTGGGLILIGGPITDSTKGYAESAPEGTNIALVLQRGSPVKAEIFGEWTGPHEPSCSKFLESVPDVGDPERDPSALEPIDGTIELRP